MGTTTQSVEQVIQRGNDSSGQNGGKLKALLSKVQTTKNMAELLPSLIDDIKSLLNCEAITLFSLDRPHRQLYSRNYISDECPEIRLDISLKSLVGYVAAVGKSLNIADAYSKEELAKYHPQLGQGSTWDQKLNLKTKSVLAVPLPYNRKLIGVLEIINKKEGETFSDADFKIARDISPALGLVLARLDEAVAKDGKPGEKPVSAEKPISSEERLHNISQAIHSAKNVDEILIELKDSILKLFDATRITIYAVDATKNEIYSKMKSGDQIATIRVPISPISVAGWVALDQKPANIENVYSDQELKKYHVELSFDNSWDKKSGFKTQSMLVYPMIHDDQLMGVIQLINKKGGVKFNPADEKNAQIITEVLSLALHNQKKFVQQKPTKFSHLLNEGIITENELTTAISKARKSQIDIENILLDEMGLQREDIGKSLELFYSRPYFKYEDSIILPKDAMAGLNKAFMAKNYWIPIQIDGNKVTLLTNDPTNPDKAQNIKLIFPKKEIDYKVGLKADILDFLNSVLADGETVSVSTDDEGVSSLLSALNSEQDDATFDAGEDDDDTNAISENDSAIVRLVNKILTDAYDEGVSDIHIEPGIGKEKMVVRYRKDGACRVYEEIPALYKQAFISRIKIMSMLDIAERRLPQDGKIKMKYGSNEVEFRVATCPTVGGNEDAVLRILAASKPIPLDNMNFAQRNLTLTKDMAEKPYGLILVVGPTGSGKTTTLHSVLGYINKPHIKIWTAEDPVEITQKGLRQVQMLNKIGLDFARAMKSFLRGDPDVIMVGEMRDAETCSIGLEASLTGHLVFSTLHTNSAPETITRLIDMGMNPLNFSDALLLILAQRLVRTLCKKCKEPYHPDKEEFDKLVNQYGEEQFPELGIEYTDDLMLNKPVGCAKCNDTGYAGRTGLHELLEGTDDIKRMIMQKKLVEELRAQAIKDGMTTLKQDGIYKVFKGDCDLKQVMAVCIV